MRTCLVVVGMLWLALNGLVIQQESQDESPSGRGRLTTTNGVFLAANSAKFTPGILWAREEAIKFGFEQQASLHKYLFAAAAFILAMIAKILFDPMASMENKGFRIPNSSFWTFTLSALFAVSSAIQGILGVGKLAEVSYANAWFATGPSAVYMAYQEIFLFIAIVLLLISIFWTIAIGQRSLKPLEV